MFDNKADISVWHAKIVEIASHQQEFMKPPLLRIAALLKNESGLTEDKINWAVNQVLKNFDQRAKNASWILIDTMHGVKVEQERKQTHCPSVEKTPQNFYSLGF